MPAEYTNLQPHYKVRVYIKGAGLLHLASWDEPEVEVINLNIVNVTARWVDDYPYGDTLGFIQWSKITAISWRWEPLDA